MSSVQTFLVQDDRLLVTDQVKYAVLKGAANNTLVYYDAISGLNGSALPTVNSYVSALTWNIQVPSQEVVIDRRALIEYTVRARIRKTVEAGAGAADQVWAQTKSGVNTSCDSLNVFPVSQCVQTIQATINNTTVANNVQDVLEPLLRFHDSRELSEYMGMAPYLIDRQGMYNGVNGLTNFQTSSTAVFDEAFIPRSAFPCKITDVRSNLDVSTDNSIDGATPGEFKDAIVEFTTWEPLFVSPFIWANPKVNSQGIYGVQNISIVQNFGNHQRLIKSLPQITVGGAVTSKTQVMAMNVVSSRLYLNYLTPQPSSVMVPRNVVPYYETPRYFLTTPTDLTPATFDNDLNTITRSASKNFRAQNLQLNQIPDKLIIVLQRESVSGAVEVVPVNGVGGSALPAGFAVIEKMNINFNNQSGLLSTWSQKDLYHASRDGGSKQSWYEFTGEVQVPTNVQTEITYNNGLPVGSQLSGGTFTSSQSTNQPTSGSVLILQFGKDIELPDYYAPGSIGNFNLQISLDAYHYLPCSALYRLMVITVNSGVFVTEKGTSNPYTALLRKEDVLNASSMEPLGCAEFNRMVGGGFFDTLKSIGSTVWKYGKPVLKALAPVAQSLLGQSSDPRAQMASKIVGVGSKLMGDGMGAGEDRLARHARGSGYAY